MIVAATQVKLLLDELASVLAEMGALEETAEEGENSAPMTEEQEASLRELEQKADSLRDRIAFHERIAEKEKELRAVLERSAPAPAPAPVEEKEPSVESRNIPRPVNRTNLRAFRDSDTAYRAGMHIRGFLLGDADARNWCFDHGVESRAQAGQTASAGGVLVAEDLSNEIIRLVEEYGAFPANARRVPMNSDNMVMARRTGGLTARAVGENTEITSSDVTFDNVTLTARIWGIANRIPNSLLEDSVIDLADFMALETAQAFAEAFDNTGFIGDGTSTYHSETGVTVKIVDGNHGASVVTAPSGNTTFDTLDLEDFTACVAKLPLFAKRNAKWYVSPSGWGASMLRLMAAAGGNTKGDVASGYAEQFLGYPVVLVHSMVGDLSGTASEVGCLFGDLSQAATFGERRSISIRTASERYIEYDQTLTFASTRNAISVHDLGSNSVAGPMIALQFAAT